MLSTRKKIAGAVGLVMATAGVAAAAGSNSSAAGIPVLQRKAAVSVSIVPSAIGPGKGLQTSSSAQWAVIGKYSPNKEGKKVVLQRQSGTSWVTADKGEIDAKGTVIFARGRHAGRGLPGRRPGCGQHPGQHRLVGHRGRLLRRLHRQLARPHPVAAPSAVLRARLEAHLLEGRPEGRQGRSRHRPAERARRQDQEVALQAAEAQQPEEDLRQVQVAAERQHRHAGDALHQLRRGGRPDQVPAAPGAARLAVDAAGLPQRHPATRASPAPRSTSSSGSARTRPVAG